MHRNKARNSFKSIISKIRSISTLLIIPVLVIPDVSCAGQLGINYLLRFDVVGISSNQHSANAIATFPDGGVLVAGMVNRMSGGDIALVKLLPGAGVDESFGEGGWAFIDVTESDSATAISIQPDGKIVLGGWVGRGKKRDFAVARLNPDGSRDDSFGRNGVSVVSVASDGSDHINDLALLPDGKILVVGVVRVDEGDDRVASARLNPDGMLDRTFADSGVLVIRLADGEQKQNTCKSLCGGASSIAVTPEGDYLIGAETPPDAKVSEWRSWVIKLRPMGVADSSFGDAGKREVFRSEEDSTGTTRVVLPPNGGIVVGGGSSVIRRGEQFRLTRLTSSGNVDRSFGTNGTVTTQIASPTAEAGILALEACADGKLLAAGGVDAHDGAGLQFVVARYLESGFLDTGFAENGLLIGGYSPADGADALFAMSVTPTGGFAAAGWAQIAPGAKGIRFGVVRYEDQWNLSSTNPSVPLDHVALYPGAD